MCILTAAVVLLGSAAQPDTPKIIALQMSESVVHSGDTVFGRLTTSPDVTSVVAHLAMFSLVVPRVTPGHFAVKYTVPNVPFFLHGNYSIDVVAKTSKGAEVHRSVPVTVQ